jgi:hypothetical protein
MAIVLGLLLTLSPSVVLVNSQSDVPVKGAMVYADGPQGFGYNISDASGAYTITTGLKTGTYNMTTLAEGYILKTISGVSVTVGQNTQNIDFNLLRSGGVSGKVTDSVSGQGLQGIMILASSKSGFGYYAVTDAQGNYRIITNLQTGTYNITVTMPKGYIMKAVSGVSITAGVETKRQLSTEQIWHHLREGNNHRRPTTPRHISNRLHGRKQFHGL